jgi:hypothetical protein
MPRYSTRKNIERGKAMSVTSRRLPHSDVVAPFEDFDFDLDGIGALIYQTINERLEQHLAEYPPRLSLPVRWGTEHDGNDGPPVSDPLTIYLHLPFDDKRDGTCLWTFPLTELMDEELFDHGIGPEDWCDEDWDDMTPRAKLVIDALRALADKIEQRVQTRT